MRYAVTHGQKSDSAGNLVGTQAVRADINCLVSSADDSLYSSDVGLPCSVGLSVRVGNVVTESNALSADFALCHLWTPPVFARLAYVAFQPES